MQVSRTALLRGTVLGGGFFLVAGVVTGLIPTPVFERMVARAPLDYVFLLLTSLLIGVYVVQRTSQANCGDRCAYGGAATGFFAVACPHCNALLVGLASATWLATYVDPLRPLFGVMAVGLLAGTVYVRRSG